MMAAAADFTIAEVEEIVEAGEIHPDQVHVPGIYVNRIFKGVPSKRIERLTVIDMAENKAANPSAPTKNKDYDKRERIAKYEYQNDLSHVVPI